MLRTAGILRVWGKQGQYLVGLDVADFEFGEHGAEAGDGLQGPIFTWAVVEQMPIGFDDGVFGDANEKILLLFKNHWIPDDFGDVKADATKAKHGPITLSEPYHQVLFVVFPGEVASGEAKRIDDDGGEAIAHVEVVAGAHLFIGDGISHGRQFMKKGDGDGLFGWGGENRVNTDSASQLSQSPTQAVGKCRLAAGSECKDLHRIACPARRAIALQIWKTVFDSRTWQHENWEFADGDHDKFGHRPAGIARQLDHRHSDRDGLWLGGECLRQRGHRKDFQP